MNKKISSFPNSNQEKESKFDLFLRQNLQHIRLHLSTTISQPQKQKLIQDIQLKLLTIGKSRQAPVVSLTKYAGFKPSLTAAALILAGLTLTFHTEWNSKSGYMAAHPQMKRTVSVHPVHLPIQTLSPWHQVVLHPGQLQPPAVPRAQLPQRNEVTHWPIWKQRPENLLLQKEVTIPNHFHLAQYQGFNP